MKDTIYGLLGILLIIIGLLWIGKPDETSKNNSVNFIVASTNNYLATTENIFNFGPVSMAKGKVSHEFRIKNVSSESIIINKIYTSCMCTKARLIVNENEFGPYGMPGHGSIPKIDVALETNTEAVVRVIFDPNAHGPAGIGKIERVVTIENSAGEPVELGFTAEVTP